MAAGGISAHVTELEVGRYQHSAHFLGSPEYHVIWRPGQPSDADMLCFVPVLPKGNGQRFGKGLVYQETDQR